MDSAINYGLQTAGIAVLGGAGGRKKGNAVIRSLRARRRCAERDRCAAAAIVRREFNNSGKQFPPEMDGRNISEETFEMIRPKIENDPQLAALVECFVAIDTYWRS